MKNNLFATACAVIALPLLMASCGGGSSIYLHEEGSGDKLREQFEKVAGPDAVVYNITINAADVFSFRASDAVIFYSEPGSDDVKGTVITFSPYTTSESLSSAFDKRTPETGIVLKDLDLSQVASNIKKGLAFMGENDAKGDGMKQYRIIIDSADPAAVYSRFEINEKGETKTYGTQRRTEYYEYEFRADHEGNVEYLD